MNSISGKVTFIWHEIEYTSDTVTYLSRASDYVEEKPRESNLELIVN